ncbi:MAG: ASCH domain-containing protein [Sandaracinus sp.]
MPNERITYRCLAIRQPYAWAIVMGAKDIENRSWSTTHRGQIVIQASTTKAEVNATTKHFKPQKPPVTTVPFEYGALIGVADLVDVVPLTPELEANPWAYGTYCFRLANARVFDEPIVAKGKLNLYHLDDALDAQVRERLPRAKHVTPSDGDAAWLKMLHADPVEQETAFIEGYRALEAWPDVVRLTTKRIEAERGEPYDLALRGLARGLLDDLETGIADVDRAIESAPEPDGLFFFWRGLMHKEVGNADAAQQDLARARELDPTLVEGAPIAGDTDLADEDA